MIFEGVRKLVHGAEVVAEAVAHEPQVGNLLGRSVQVLARGVDGAVVGLIIGGIGAYALIKLGEHKDKFADYLFGGVTFVVASVAIGTIVGVGYELAS